jgi:hypothetical protein
MYAIPGNHDLPLHNYDDIKKSAYWTLVEAEAITDLQPMPECSSHMFEDMIVCPYPYSYPCPYNPAKEKGNKICVALIHDYIWIDKCGFPNANPSRRISENSEWAKNLKGFDVAIFGDNHIGFKTTCNKGKTIILNGGAFMRRNIDQIKYKPFVGLIYSDGSVEQHYLDVFEDKFIETKLEWNGNEIDMSDFLETLKNGSKAVIDFTEAVENYLSNPKSPLSKQVRKIVREALEQT